jgi:hypothetical protein
MVSSVQRPNGSSWYDIAMRRGLLIVGALVLLFALGALAAAARGSRGAVDLAHASPQMKRICLSQLPRTDRELIDRCFRVHGTLLHVWRERDEGGRVADMHFLVVARLHLYVVKVHEPFPANPRVGHTILVIGPLVRPHPEHLGIHEIDAFSLSGAGT